MTSETTNENPSPMLNDRLALFGVSLISLFIEIMLIRHLGSEIRIFAYFKNLALIGAFLGLGFGYLYKPRISPAATVVCMALIALATHPSSGFNKISEFMSLSGLNTWTQDNHDSLALAFGILLLTILFSLVIISMIPLGQVLAGIFDKSRNRILDYTVNIAGSLVGVWLFSLASFLWTQPAVWYMFSAAGIAVMLRRRRNELAVALISAGVIVLALLGQSTGGGEVKWSPYQKITIRKQAVVYQWEGVQKRVDFVKIDVNSIIYMYLLDLSLKHRREHPALFDEKTDPYLYYDIPYNYPRKLDEVLVLGSGGGNDVAAALRAGAKHVTAVEIDPAIIETGKKLHPEKPYLSDRVTIVNNDARNYLRNADKKFDLIILGLLDSHTLSSNFSNTNLDSFMYTSESVGDMRALLQDGGVLALSFQINHAWIGTKIMRMMEEKFHSEAQVIVFKGQGFDLLRGTGGMYFISSKDNALKDQRLKEDKTLRDIVTDSLPASKYYKSLDAKPQTDDWPYLYIQNASIPTLHLLVTAILAIIFIVLALTSFGAPGKSELHFAGLGAGFLLMEVAVISRFGLFWGTTWIVSSIVISLILVAILIANTLYLWVGKRAPYPVIYGVIGVLLLMVYLVPLTSGWVILLYMAPFVAIGLLFAQSFDGSAVPSKALAYNLFGALVGGLSESLSFVTGISSLILVGMAFYAFSALFAGAVGRTK